MCLFLAPSGSFLELLRAISLFRRCFRQGRPHGKARLPGSGSGSFAMVRALALALACSVARAQNWPACQEQNTVIRNAGKALFTNLQGYGAVIGCFLDDCMSSDKFVANEIESCAKVCFSLPELGALIGCGELRRVSRSAGSEPVTMEGKQARAGSPGPRVATHPVRQCYPWATPSVGPRASATRTAAKRSSGPTAMPSAGTASTTTTAVASQKRSSRF
eukprot:s2025_g4.t2